MAVKTADCFRMDATPQLCILKRLGAGGGVHIQEFPTDFPNYPWREMQLLSLSRNACKAFGMSRFQTSLVSKSRGGETVPDGKWKTKGTQLRTHQTSEIRHYAAVDSEPGEVCV